MSHCPNLPPVVWKSDFHGTPEVFELLDGVVDKKGSEEDAEEEALRMAMPHKLDYGRQECERYEARPIFRVLAGLFCLLTLFLILTWVYDVVTQHDFHVSATSLVCVFAGFFYSGCIAVRGRMPFTKSA